jgi:hypothetical protein
MSTSRGTGVVIFAERRDAHFHRRPFGGQHDGNAIDAIDWLRCHFINPRNAGGIWEETLVDHLDSFIENFLGVWT